MVRRDTYRASERGCDLSIVTEQMGDGRWAVAVTVEQLTDGARQVTPLPMGHERFLTEEEARDHGLRMGAAWIEQNTPDPHSPAGVA